MYTDAMNQWSNDNNYSTYDPFGTSILQNVNDVTEEIRNTSPNSNQSKPSYSDVAKHAKNKRRSSGKSDQSSPAEVGASGGINKANEQPAPKHAGFRRAKVLP